MAAAKVKAKKDCVDADPRLVMAVLAIGMIVGAIVTPSKTIENGLNQALKAVGK